MSYPGTQGPTLTVRHTGQVFALGSAPITIGTQGDNTIVLADPDASPLHAIVSWQAGAFTVLDAGSAKGTYLNERRVRSPRPLRDGNVLRMGNTLFDIRIPFAAAAAAPAHGPASAGASAAGGRPSRPSTGVIAGLLAGAFLVVCLATALIFLLLDPNRGGVSVTLHSPEESAQLPMGGTTTLRADARGARDITRLELRVDGAVVGSAQSAGSEGQASLTATALWTPDRTGPHTVTATAYRAGETSGNTVTHQVTVVDGGGGGTPSVTPPGMETPSATPSPTNTETPTPTPTGTPVVGPAPVIEFFRANPQTIDLGQCTTLEWGQVTGAVVAIIDHGIGGVATPGSQMVCPIVTTSYGMTASGPGGVTMLAVTVTVRAGQPDLVIDGVVFSPDPPVQGGDTLVEIQIRNAGTAAAGAFAWEWQAGSSTPFNSMVPGGLAAGASTSVSLTWRPDSAYAGLVTTARADTGNAVAESDEANNELQLTVKVVASSTTVVLLGEPSLDGYVTGGRGAYSAGEIRAGNEGGDVHRGFLSFDLQGIPGGATVESASLRFYQVNITGQPYRKLGGLMLTPVDCGASLDISDFDTPGLGGVVLLGKKNRPGSWFDVQSADIVPLIDGARSAGRAWLQLRLQFATETDGDGEPDYVQVEAGDNSLGTGNVPELTITYSVP